MYGITRRRTATGAGLLIATTLLAGCFSVESTFTINEDGTADIELVTLIDTEQLSEIGDLLGQDLGDLGGLTGDDLLSELTDGENPCGDLGSSLTGFDVTTEQIDNGSEVGVSCTVEGVPIEDLSTVGTDSSFTIEQDDTGTRFSAVLEGVDELTGGETDDLTQLLDINLDELFSIVFTVTGPGSLGDNNATSTSGSTASWDVTADADFVTNGDAVMTAEWAPGGGSDSNWLIIVIVLGVIAALAIVGIALARKSRQKGSPTAPAPPTTPEAASPPPPPPPPPFSPPPPPPPS